MVLKRYIVSTSPLTKVGVIVRKSEDGQFISLTAYPEL